MYLAIIGSAGRRDDADRMTPDLYAEMCAEARLMVRDVGATRLISGGAAFADHVAVTLFLEDVVSELQLHLPAPWQGSAYADRGDGRTANFYHEAFSRACGLDSLAELSRAAEKGAMTASYRGFKERNTRVAASDAILAFTFGAGGDHRFWPGETLALRAGLKPGGTADTWNKAVFAKFKRHVDLGQLEHRLTTALRP
ncbi:hypothetical protein [Bosea sp. ANAM02]|uniref:hypothetical protein n=1 Tax=Bosea sp. ANAM02 TaxID=2020412 RepID=UPI00140E9F2F|nr:hypothetical protein [Bosea sp. ANAM02]BCB22027.1 hypothetical protein OCUBac02_49210 [Bosea sp. ANAM02]